MICITGGRRGGNTSGSEVSEVLQKLYDLEEGKEGKEMTKLRKRLDREIEEGNRIEEGVREEREREEKAEGLWLDTLALGWTNASLEYYQTLVEVEITSIKWGIAKCPPPISRKQAEAYNAITLTEDILKSGKLGLVESNKLFNHLKDSICHYWLMKLDLDIIFPLTLIGRINIFCRNERELFEAIFVGWANTGGCIGIAFDEGRKKFSLQ